jgi:hypothetical protein
MYFFKSKRGYFFRNSCAGIVKVGENYSIQIRINTTPKQVWTIYRSNKKPRFRHLGVISLLFPFFCIARLAVHAYFLLILFVTYPLMCISALIRAFCQALIFDFKAAKIELKTIFNHRW